MNFITIQYAFIFWLLVVDNLSLFFQNFMHSHHISAEAKREGHGQKEAISYTQVAIDIRYMHVKNMRIINSITLGTCV